MDDAPNRDVWEVDFGFLQQRPDSGNPEGGRHGWGPFSDRGRMPSPKIPVTSAWLERFVEEGAFFGCFLCTGKESNSPKAKALRQEGECFSPSNDGQRSSSFRPDGRGTFFCWPKRKYPKKTAFLVTSNPPTVCEMSLSFSDSPSMARSEKGGHPWPPPSGCSIKLGSG